MEIILIIAPCYAHKEMMEQFYTALKNLPKGPDTTIFLIKDELNDEWKLLSNKLNPELIEKYSVLFKEEETIVSLEEIMKDPDGFEFGGEEEGE